MRATAIPAIPGTLVALAACAVLAGCGGDSTAPGTTATADSPAGPASEAATHTPDSADTPCETVRGPEGALRVVVFDGSEVGCAEVMPVATSYGQYLATGEPHSIDGWDCGPSQAPRVLVTCTRGTDAFGFVVE
ncbi:MAG TPA: hypothetical protein VIW24_05185 [Aldersonia sp.]